MRTSHFAPDGKVVKYYYEDAKTCYEVFVRGIKVSGEFIINYITNGF